MLDNRSAFRQVADESSRGRFAEVTIYCPKCQKVLRTVKMQVNGFNEWSFSKEYDPKAGRYYYFSRSADGRGCCF